MQNAADPAVLLKYVCLCLQQPLTPLVCLLWLSPQLENW